MMQTTHWLTLCQLREHVVLYGPSLKQRLMALTHEKHAIGTLFGQVVTEATSSGCFYDLQSRQGELTDDHGITNFRPPFCSLL